MRQKVLLVAAIAFGLLAGYLAYNQLKYERNKLLARTQKVDLIVLKNDIAEGDTINEDDIEIKQVERFRSQRSDEILWKNRKLDVIKQKADRSLFAGTILRYSDLQTVGSKKDGLAGIIPIGSRAISISVDATSSVTALIKPEDRVDIIGTFRFPEMKGDKSLDVITMTILQSVRVLATGKTMGIQRSSSRSRSRGYNTVTLELTPEEVEMIIFASQKGRLVLSLRSFNETGFENKLQSVNFRYLEENIEKYNKERQKRCGLGR